MIKTIIAYAIRHKMVVGLMLLMLIGGGIYSLCNLSVDTTPDITNNQVQVITVSQNLSTTDMEQYVTYPVEQAMANLPGVEDVRSISRFGLSVVTVVFKENMDTYLPRQLVQEKLAEVKEQIPEGMGSPEIGPITTGLGEIYQYTLRPDDSTRYTATELRTIQDWIVRRQLSMIPGVVDINSFGGSVRQYEVAVSPDRLHSMGVTMREVYRALSQANGNTGGAYIEHGHQARFIRGEGLLESISQIRQIVVRNDGGIPLTIGDVADSVSFGHQVRYGAFTQDGREAVGGMVLMLKGENSARVVKAVKARIEEVQKSLPKDIRITPFLDRSELISRTTSTIARNLMEGALIVVVVLVLLLGSLRGGLLTASVIPLALLFAFIMMKLFGVWANLMSLGAIDFGIIVDGAVIIVEETVHRMSGAIGGAHTGLSRRAIADKVSGESAATMMHSAFFGQLIILIVFAPILFLTGVSGKMFRPMALTFSFAILGAILLCLTYVPVAASLVMRPLKRKNGPLARCESRLSRFSGKVMGRITAIYVPLLHFSLRRSAPVLLSAVALLGLTGVVFHRMGGEFIPSLDEGDIAMQTFLRPGSSLSETIKREEEVERVLLNTFPEIKTVCARIGVADIPTDPMGFDYTDSFIILEKDRSKWTSAKTKEELIEKIKTKLMELPGLNFSFSQPVALRFNELLTGVREDVAVKLYGEDLDKLNEYGEEIASMVNRIDGAEDVSLERTAGLPQISVKYNREKLARYGLNVEQLNQYISAAFAGGKAGVIFEGEKRFDLVVRLSESRRKSINDLKMLFVDLPDGTQIPLSEVADIQYQPGPMQISRDRASRRIYVGVNVRGRDVASVVADIQQVLDKKLRMEPGYHITYGGEFENLQHAKQRLAIVLPIALLLIFILLFLALRSVRQALMIYIAVPMAAIGGVMALCLRGMPFSISAGVGFIVLFGVAVLNGLVLINRFNSLKQEGMKNLYHRIAAGTRERLRPILLTATSAMLGFLPMAVSGSAGAEVQRPLATVVIGGLLSATFLTLIVVPILYACEEKMNKFYLRKATAVSLLLLFLLPASTGAATPISLRDAQNRALTVYPSLRASQLEMKRRQVLRRTAYDVGPTEISTGGEELGRDGDAAVRTLIQVRQSLDIFGIGARLQYQSRAADVSASEAEVAAADVQREVSLDYAAASVARQRCRTYLRLDSIYRDFERAARLRYETEATSQLEYLSAQSQARKAALALKQAQHDYAIALSNLCRWLDGDYEPDCTLLSLNSIAMTPAPLSAKADTVPPGPDTLRLRAHPLLTLSEQRIRLADARVKMEQSEFLPKLYVEAGSQKVGSSTGYYSYQIGVSLPLAFGAQAARVKAARLERDAAEANYRAEMAAAKSATAVLLQEQNKWLQSIDYYRTEALPTALKRREATKMAYQEGATDYLGFIQNMKECAQTELDYWDAWANYYSAHFKLEYYYQPSSNLK